MKLKDISHKDIAESIGKSLHTINNWTVKFPKLLNYAKIGVFCEKNDLDIEKIKKLVELQEMIKGSK